MIGFQEISLSTAQAEGAVEASEAAGGAALTFLIFILYLIQYVSVCMSVQKILIIIRNKKIRNMQNMCL